MRGLFLGVGFGIIDEQPLSRGAEPYHVGTPLPSVDMGQQRRIGSQPHHIGIALHAGEEGRLGKGGFEIVGTRLVVRGILAGRDAKTGRITSQ